MRFALFAIASCLTLCAQAQTKLKKGNTPGPQSPEALEFLRKLQPVADGSPLGRRKLDNQMDSVGQVPLGQLNRARTDGMPVVITLPHTDQMNAYTTRVVPVKPRQLSPEQLNRLNDSLRARGFAPLRP